VEDLVGVGVADSGEEAGVGQGALRGVVLARQGGAEVRLAGVQHLEAPSVELGERRGALDQVERRPLPGARLGEDERAVGEVEREERAPAADPPAGPAPVQASGDHEVEDQEQIALEREHDPLPEAAQPDDAPALGAGDRRGDRAEEERAAQADALEALFLDTRRECREVREDVGKLRHGE